MEREASFQARTGGGAIGRVPLIVWGLVLVVVVGAGVWGTLREPGPDRAVTVVRESTVHADPGPLTVPVRFVRPSTPFEEVTTPRLLVTGTTEPDIQFVTVRLEAREGRIIGRQVVETVASVHGGREFATSLAIPNPRPNGTMWVRLEPTDLGPAAGIRIAVLIGPNEGAVPTVPGPWAPLGDDGFLGNVGAR